MLRRLLLAGAILAALAGVYFSGINTADTAASPPSIRGRNGTVLFLTTTANGLSNVHLAASYALLTNYPSLEVHYGSFARLAPQVARISASARAKNPAAGSIQWHELRGLDYVDAALRSWNSSDGLVSPPGQAGLDAMLNILEYGVAPWHPEEHWELYREVAKLIEEVDPAVIALDVFMRPAMDYRFNVDRRFVIMNPNALSDIFSFDQPYAAAFWKYPSLGSDLPFPIPWSKIITAIWERLRFVLWVVSNPRLLEVRAYLRDKGVQNPLDFVSGPNEEQPWLLMSFPEANAPLTRIPPGAVICGPMVLDLAPAEQQDPELAAWLKRAPTVLVNLGSAVMYTEQRASAMAASFAEVLEKTDVQILWKFRKSGELDDGFLKPIDKYVESGRVRLENWLNVDPPSLLQTGDVVLSVHHGGANCFYETISAGIPHVILPLWLDLYNFATTAEYLGVGIWPGKDTAPEWHADTLAKGFLAALVGDESVSMRQKAKALGAVAATYGGRDRAAAEVARLAVQQ
ncbi:hypothetical protein S40288_03412 [Stachybotrys chartarum IBT 40288]|nr:hypothetical protein S40288_03412 [Stachybotrys chartarum IBT 40288]